MGSEKQMVVFHLADIEFGLPVESIQEIVRPGTFVRVPLTPAYILGLTNLRGSILPVVDLRLRLGLPAGPTDEHTRLLVLCKGEVMMCLLVDGVREVRSYTEDILEPPPDTGEDYGGFVRQVAKFDGGERVVFWLEEEKLFGEQVKGLPESGGINSLSSSAEKKEAEISQEIRLLSFRLGGEEYAFPIDRVREIIRYRVLRPLPEAPSFVKGLLTIRQRIVPVFDLRALLGLEPHTEEVNRRVNHLQELFSHQLLRLEKDPVLGRKEILKAGADFLLPVWIEERLERCRHEEEFQLLKGLKYAWESFLQSVAQGANPQPEAERILEGLEKLKETLAKSLPEEERIVILEKNRRRFGLIVDRVEEVCSIPEASVEHPPEGEDLAGIAKLSGKRIIFILNEEALIPQEELEEFTEEEEEEMVQEKNQEKARECQLVTFYLGDEEYGIPITRIQEINRVGKITRVPHTPDFVEGVTNLRGEIIPVIDLRKRLGLEERPLDDRTRLVIVQINGKKTGFIVDRVQEVARLLPEQLESPPQMLETEIDLAFISSIAKLGEGRMIIVLDIDHILFPEEKEALGQMAGKMEEENEEALFQIAE